MVARSAGVLTASVDDDPIDRTNSAEPRTATEKTFAEVLANILHVDGVPVDSHFFDDLGADSLMMAQFCARVLVESSSGNLGVALSMIAANKGYRFLCVTDRRCNLTTRLMMEALGSRVHIIDQPDPVSGFVGARINYVRAACAADNRYVWLNQYSNPSNWIAHYRRTAPAIARQFPQLDVLFVGAGTTGTLMGCARYFRRWHKPVRIIAVDTVGSVTFGTAPGPRMIPGLGMSTRPPLLDQSYVDEVVHVEEADTIRACHRMARSGFLFGGSTGTVVSGATRWLAQHDTRQLTAVAIAPDLGERYLDTIYQTNWLVDIYGEDVLTSDELVTDSPAA